MNVLEKLQHLTSLPDDKVVVLSRTEAAQILAQLQAAEELAKYVEKHLNYQDTSVPSLLQAYRAAGKGE